MITRRTLISNVLLGFFITFPQLSNAETFTSAEVLNWEASEQTGYFQASVTMIGIVATQTGKHDHIAECIDNWYGGGETSQPKRSARILEVMQGLPDFHPQAVILAVIEKECGEF